MAARKSARVAGAVEQQVRIHHCAVHADAPVQVGSGHPAAAADRTDDLATRDRIAGGDVDSVHVAIHRYQSLTVVDEYRVAIKKEVAGFDDTAGRGGVYRGAGRGRDVDPAVRPARLFVASPA